jgi:hypothetical protein
MSTNSRGDNVTKTVSLPTEMHDAVKLRMDDLKIRNFSRYIQDLIREDLRKRGALVVADHTTAYILNDPPNSGKSALADALQLAMPDKPGAPVRGKAIYGKRSTARHKDATRHPSSGSKSPAN